MKQQDSKALAINLTQRRDFKQDYLLSLAQQAQIRERVILCLKQDVP